MARLKPKKPREIAQIGEDQQAIDRMAREELMPMYQHTGTVTPIKRRVSAFMVLRESGTISSSQAGAAARLMSLYVTLAQVGEAPEREDVEDYFCRERLDDAHVAILRAKGVIWAEDKYKKTCRKIGPLSAEILTALYKDFLEGDHEPPTRNQNGKVIPRWRLRVREVLKHHGKTVATPNEENLAVWWACEELNNSI